MYVCSLCTHCGIPTMIAAGKSVYLCSSQMTYHIFRLNYVCECVCVPLLQSPQA